MGTRSYSIYRKVKVNLEIEVEVGSLYEWKGNPISDEELKEYIEGDMAGQIAEHLAGDLCQGHILETGPYDEVHFDVEYKNIKYDGALI